MLDPTQWEDNLTGENMAKSSALIRFPSEE
jgi:hypothetical protein